MAVPDLTETSYYALRPSTPVRAWVIAVLAMAAGVWVCLTGWQDPRNTLTIVAGAALALGGVALGMTAAAFVSSRTLHIVLSPQGYEVSGPGYHKEGAWIDVDAVSATPDGSRLVIARGQVDRVFIQAPGGEADAQMQAITDDISARLQGLET